MSICSQLAMASSTMLRALGGACRVAREVLSYSTIRLQCTPGAHLHRIDHYPKVAGMSAGSLPDQRIESAPFVVGGYKWQLHFYPNGDVVSQPGRAAVDLVLKGSPQWRPFCISRDMAAAYKVSVLDGDGDQVLDRAVGLRRFSEWGSDRAMSVATAEKLRSAAMRGGKDDGGELVIRCDLNVMTIEEESRVKWYLRQLVSKF